MGRRTRESQGPENMARSSVWLEWRGPGKSSSRDLTGGREKITKEMYQQI